MTREEYVSALRALADFYEKHEVPAPAVLDMVNVYVSSDEMPRVARALGSFEKRASEDYFALHKVVAPGVVIEFFDYRSGICKKRVIGIERVKETIATAWEDKEVEREIVEWDCPTLLAPKAEPAPVPVPVEESVF